MPNDLEEAVNIAGALLLRVRGRIMTVAQRHRTTSGVCVIVDGSHSRRIASGSRVALFGRWYAGEPPCGDGDLLGTFGHVMVCAPW